jgi:hypothetical protein
VVGYPEKGGFALSEGVVKESGSSAIEFEQTAQSVATVNGPTLQHQVRSREEEKIAFALVCTQSLHGVTRLLPSRSTVR